MEISLKPSNYSKRINKKELIKNLFDFNLGSVLTEIVHIDDSKERKAFLLMFTALQKTNINLTKYYGQEILNSTYNLVNIVEELELEFKMFLEKEVKITHNFFKDVLNENNNYIIAAFDLFKSFCNKINIVLSEDVRFRYYHDFRCNLENEFQENKDKYKELVDFFDNPIFEQNLKFEIMLEYYTYIKKFFINKLQNDDERNETLQDLYIEPFFEIYRNNLKKEFIENIENNFFQSGDINIHEFFNNYFFKGNKLERLKENYDMIFLLGQPGQGKTSFCYKLIYDYLETNKDLPQNPIFFIKIRELAAQDFISNPFDTINKHISQSIHLDSEEGFLILDGLDEAYMSGGINEADLRNLYERLKKRANKRLKIILTSRFSYLQVNDSCLDNTLILQLSNLSDEQILEYSKKFGRFYPENQFESQVELVVASDKYFHVKELLQQAVLIYFIGISNIIIDEKDSRAKIYDKIFDAMAQRSWDRNSGQLDYINSKMKNNVIAYKRNLRNYLSSLAFEIYQSPKLFITLKQLSNLDATKIFVKKCFQEDLLDSPDKIKEINKYLLISFYFQESNNNKNGEAAIEFFHNSLFEYLTAEYLWEENKKLLLSRDADGDLMDISYKEYFKLLNTLVGNKKTGFSVFYNLEEIIENESEEIKDLIYNQSIKNYHKLLQLDFLLSFDKENCLLTSKEKSYELFKLFWYFLNETNTKKLLKIEDDTTEYLINAFGISDVVLKNLDINLNLFNGCFLLFTSDLYNIHFTSGLLRAEFHESIIENTLFKNIDFMNSILAENDFNNVVFSNCDLGSYTNVLSRNKFTNCVFDNVRIYSEDWYVDFCEDNIIDEVTKQSHIIQKINDRYRSGLYIVNINM